MVELCPGADQVWFREVVSLLLKAKDPRKVRAKTFDGVRRRTKRVTGAVVVDAIRASHPSSSGCLRAFKVAAQPLLAELTLARAQLRKLEQEMTEVLCHHAAQQAMFHAAARASSVDPRFRALHTAARARGHSRPRALRAVADAMLRVLVAMLRDRTLYVDGSLKEGPQLEPTSAATNV